jgi:hypothetical protein
MESELWSDGEMYNSMDISLALDTGAYRKGALDP